MDGISGSFHASTNVKILIWLAYQEFQTGVESSCDCFLVTSGSRDRKSTGSSIGDSSKLERKNRWKGTAARAPRNGPTMKTQKVPGQVPETIAGPKDLAGLMEQPSMGNRTA